MTSERLQDAQEILLKTFGFSHFREGQSEVIDHLLHGRSAAAVFPTGRGKSLCYQLPALIFDGLTIVVSPLLALMKDQVDKLLSLGIAACRLDSTLTADETRAIYQRLRLKELCLLFVAPERFNNEVFRQVLMGQRISLFAIDEAHCISEWGHNFRPDYLKLVRISRELQAERVLALTATATTAVLEDIAKQFHLEPVCLIRTGSYRPNLTLLTTPVETKHKARELCKRMEACARGPTIVYVTLQQTASGVARYLQAAGFPARAYHAGMKDEDRQEVQEWFLEADDGIVVATIAFGMGIDKADIRYIYHYNLPKTIENYSQEIGRAGRDGQPSTCELFVSYDDLPPLENFIFGDTPTRSSIRQVLQKIFTDNSEVELSLYHLGQETDIRDTVLKTLLAYLELSEHLQVRTPIYAEYRIKLLVAEDQLLSRFPSPQKTFLRQVIAQSTKGNIWYTLDVPTWQTVTGESRERLMRAFLYLQSKDLIELRPGGLRHRYHVLHQPDSVDILTEKLWSYCQHRETRECERLQLLLELIQSSTCQNTYLQKYFGETTVTSCGHCSRCLGDPVCSSLRRIPTHTPDRKLCRQAYALRKDYPDLGDELRPLIRILCGIRSPRIVRNQLHRHPLFGALSHVRFSAVEGVLKSLAQDHSTLI